MKSKSSTFVQHRAEARGSSLPDYSWPQNKAHLHSNRNAQAPKIEQKKVCSTGGSRNATECSGAAYWRAKRLRTGRGQVMDRPSASHRASVMGRVIREAASVTFISLKDLVNSSAKPTKSATVVPEKHSRMNDPRSGSGTMYKKR